MFLPVLDFTIHFTIWFVQDDPKNVNNQFLRLYWNQSLWTIGVNKINIWVYKYTWSKVTSRRRTIYKNVNNSDKYIYPDTILCRSKWQRSYQQFYMHINECVPHYCPTTHVIRWVPLKYPESLTMTN